MTKMFFFSLNEKADLVQFSFLKKLLYSLWYSMYTGSPSGCWAHVCIGIQNIFRPPSLSPPLALPCSAELRDRPPPWMIRHPSQPVLIGAPGGSARREVTDCVLQGRLSLDGQRVNGRADRFSWRRKWRGPPGAAESL